MEEKKDILFLSSEEGEELKKSLGRALEVYGKGDANVKKDALRILNSWGRIIFVISNDGKRIGLEITERWERERKTDKEEKTVFPKD